MEKPSPWQRTSSPCVRPGSPGCRRLLATCFTSAGSQVPLKDRVPADRGASPADVLEALQENNLRTSEKAGCDVSPPGLKWRLLW